MERLAAIREKLRTVPDPVALLESIFAFAPFGLQVYRADGHCLLVNQAFRDLFGSEPPPEYCVLDDEIAEAAGVLGLIRRAFAGETIALPPIWYDARQLRQVKVAEGRRVAIAATFFPLFDAAGAVSHVGIVFEDETTEVELRERAEAGEHALREAIDGLPALVSVIDREGRYRMVNRAYEAWWRRPREEIEGRAVEEVAGEAWREVEPSFRAALAGERADFEMAVDYADGRRRIRGNMVPLRAGDGVRAVVLLVTDVTPEYHGRQEVERARAEAEAERARMYALFQQAPLPIAITRGPSHVFELVNPAARAMLDGRELLGRSAREAFPTAAEAAIAVLDRAFADGEAVSLREYAAGGRLFDAVVQPVRDGGGAVEGLMIVLVDVTEQVHARRQAARQQAWLEAVLDLAPTPMLLVEPHTGRVTFANAAAERMADGRFPIAPFCTDRNGRRIPEEEMPGARAARGEELSGFELDWHLPTETRTLLVSTRVLPPMHDHPATVVVVFEDVSRMKRTEAELQRAVEMRDTFLSVASHELKTPLTALQLHAHRLQRGFGGGSAALSPDRVEATAHKISEQTRRMARLIDDMLDVSRITAERLTLRREEVDFSSLVAEVVDRFGEEAARAGSPITLALDPWVIGHWDRMRLEQVTTNLLGNAIKYGAGRPIDVALRADPSTARLVVRDRGIGIAEEDQRRIFERFERAASERQYGGLGLGLWIVRRIVEALGGAIQVKSAPGEGAEFVVTLPRDS